MRKVGHVQHTTTAVPPDGGRPDHLVPCPDCDGHGEFIEPEPSFDVRRDQWYPNYAEVPCERCEGVGYLDLDDPRRFG